VHFAINDDVADTLSYKIFGSDTAIVQSLTMTSTENLPNILTTWCSSEL